MKKLDQRMIVHVSTSLLCLLIFLIPSNWFYKFAENQTYVNGLLVDYLLPKFYASDLPILGLISVNLWLNRSSFTWNKIRSHWLIITLISLFALRQFLSPFPISSVWFFIKLLEMIALGWALLKLKNYFFLPAIVASFSATLVFQSIVGITQFLTQSSIAGYAFFGEGTLHSISGIAKASFSGVEKILPYGTTAHPNVLAATLLIFLCILGHIQKRKWWLILITILATIIVYLTQSQAAWLALLVVLVSFLVKVPQLPKPIWLLMTGLLLSGFLLTQFVTFWPNDWSWQRRLTLNQASLSYFVSQPVLGTGLNTNAALNEQVFTKQEIVRFAQPAHHVGLVWLSETGLLGILIAAWILKKLKPQHSLFILSILPLLVLDHYLLTLQTGLLLLVLGFVLQTYYGNTTMGDGLGEGEG